MSERISYAELVEIERSRRLLAEDTDVTPESAAAALVEGARAIERAHERTSAKRRHRDARQTLRSGGRATPATRSASRTRSSGPGAVDATAMLRMERVPAAHVHVFEAVNHPLVTFDIRNRTTTPARVRVTSFIEGYTARAIDTVDLEAGASKLVSQLPTFFPERLDALTDATRATLNVDAVELSGNDNEVRDHRTFRIWLLPRTTAVLQHRDPSTGESRDMTPYLATWVAPNAPEVMDVLRDAAARTETKRVVGYQVDAMGVHAQVRAMYEALQARGVLYVNSVTAIGVDNALVQRVRLPSQSLQTRSANCIDGAVLYASLMEAASLRPGIVLIPGHAFVAWRKQRRGRWDYLETTMTGSHSFDDAVKAARLTRKQFPKAPILDVFALREKGLFPTA